MKNALSFLLIISAAFCLVVTTAYNTKAQSKINVAEVDTNLFRDMQFRSVGPTRGGRVAAVEGILGAPNSFYMGNGPNGGVWRTDNYGQSWENLTDGKGLESTSIGAMDVADSDTSIIYVGTGTPNIRDNTLTGKGIYKSTDSGKHWEFVGLEESGAIGAIKIDPRDPDRVYVAALGHPFGKNMQRGVFKSTNGGKTWDKVLFASDSTGAVDLEFMPGNPDVIYAALWRGERKPWTIISGSDKEDGLYKSTDGGDHWSELTNGLPKGLKGRTGISVTAAEPNRVYALMEAPGKKQGLYRSEDQGENWEQVSDTAGIMSRPFYFSTITADPNNADVVYAMSVSYWKSVDGGKTFERKNVPHGDVHDLWINPNDSDIQVQGNDGGATVTRDGGNTWSTINNQPTAEFWQVRVDNHFPYRLYGGQQDNSTLVVPSLPLNNQPLGPKGWWETVGGCETGPAVPKPDNPNIVYESCKGKFGRYNRLTGQEESFWVGAQSLYGQNPSDLEYRFQRASPIEISPHNPDVLYYGSQYVHRTTNGGESFQKISPDLTAFKPEYQVIPGNINRDVTGEENFSSLNSIRVSPHNKNVIWTGANDGPVHISRDGGKNWTDITPADLPENATVDAIEPSPHTAGKAYIAAWRRFLDDFQPYIYSTTDYGKSWTLLTDGQNGIPADYPTRVVREDPDREGLLYAGTDWGLFVSFDDGQQWQQLKQGFPTTAITDIRIHDNDLVLSTYGRGFWILDNLTVFHLLDDSVSKNKNYLFKPEVAYRMRYRAPNAGVPQYPKPGAFIDFYLPDNTQAPVVMDILDDQGQHVRSLVGRFKKKKKSGNGQSSAKVTVPDSVAGTAGDFAIHKGHNRYIWDMHYPGKTVKSSDGKTYFGASAGYFAPPGQSAGPLVVPGQYTVRLSAGDWSSTQPLTIKIDPRVKNSGISVNDLKDQLELNIKIRDLLGQAKKMAADVDTLKSELDTKIKNDAGNEDELQEKLNRVSKLHRLLVTREGISYPTPKFIDQTEYLYGMITSADQRPGQDAFDRYKKLSAQFDEISNEWKSLGE